MGDTPNPYETAISVIGKTLALFDEDNLIPCFGFGDGTLQDFVQVLALLPPWICNFHRVFRPYCSHDSRSRGVQLSQRSFTLPRIRRSSDLLQTDCSESETFRSVILSLLLVLPLLLLISA